MVVHSGGRRMTDTFWGGEPSDLFVVAFCLRCFRLPSDDSGSDMTDDIGGELSFGLIGAELEACLIDNYNPHVHLRLSRVGPLFYNLQLHS